MPRRTLFYGATTVSHLQIRFKMGCFVSRSVSQHYADNRLGPDPFVFPHGGGAAGGPGPRVASTSTDRNPVTRRGRRFSGNDRGAAGACAAEFSRPPTVASCVPVAPPRRDTTWGQVFRPVAAPRSR